MAESGYYSGWSSEVSFMDLPMCACVLEQTAEQQVLEITAAVFLVQFSASHTFIDWLRVQVLAIE